MMAVKIAAGMNVAAKRKRVNLSVLRRKTRGGRKQGRKRGLDAGELCAPDSVQAKRHKVHCNCIFMLHWTTAVKYCANN